MIFYPKLAKTIDLLADAEISSARSKILQKLITYIDYKQSNSEIAKLNFICTHNSRRSQLAQVWAQTAAVYYNIEVVCFSGGEVVTEFNKTAIESLRNAGYGITREGLLNPKYLVHNATGGKPIICFSKLYDDASNPAAGFAAIMTCSDADQNCPFIPGAEERVSLLYQDPKEFDDTALMAEKYAEISLQIASEMFYVFSKLRPTQTSS